jgi:pimeloyl-ACP methyl ester carboxylesterase
VGSSPTALINRHQSLPSFWSIGPPDSGEALCLFGLPSYNGDEFIPQLSQVAHVIAPDLPGFGESDVLPAVSFPAFGQAISELLDRLSIRPRYIYLHDYGATLDADAAEDGSPRFGRQRTYAGDALPRA